MYNYSLHIAVGGELSDDTDLYSLAKSLSFFEVEPEDGRILGEEMIDEMPVFRKKWEEITVKNKPYDYKTSAVNKNKLYDLILDNPTTTTFFLKFVYGSQTIYGYFGEVDCSINEDRSLIRIKPAVLDQYTDFIENYEEEIDVFGGKNLIRNGDFEVWTAGVPDFWIKGLTTVTRESLLDKNCVSLNREVILGSDILTQAVSGIRQGRQINISFLYKYIGTTSTRSDLKFRVVLTGSTTYYLSADGGWTTTATDITYKPNALAFPKENVQDFDTYKIITDNAPVAGIVSLMFYGEGILLLDGTYASIYITNVSLISSDINYVDVNLNLLSDNLKTRPQDEIIPASRLFSGLFTNFVKSKNYDVNNDYNLLDFFNESGSPNITGMEVGMLRLHDKDDRTYQDIINALQSVGTTQLYGENDEFYLGEMCELTIFLGHYDSRGTLKSGGRTYAGYATFAREEVYKEDEENEEGDLIKPEEDVGWEPLGVDPSLNKRLWVRKPFNGAEYPWELGEIDKTEGVDPVTNFPYSWKITSKKIYPVGTNSTSIGTGIDFRDVCRKIYRSTHASRAGKEVYSMFFWNDSPYSDFFNIETGLNYFNMKQNFLNNISVVHTSTIKQISDPSLAASELNVAFKKLFDDLQVKFPSLIWFIDQDLNLHFEHVRMLHRIRDYFDISAINYINEYKSYSFDTSKLFGKIVREDTNSYYKDFKTSEEKFKRITTNKRTKDNVKELRTNIISADITGAMENPGELGNGMILVAYSVSSGENEIVSGTGQITGNLIPNGVLATSYLLKEFGKYVGTWHKGTIDGQSIDYHFSQYCKTGSDITLKGIISENYLLTDIGMALIKEKKYDYEREETICTPVYRHEDYYVVAESGDTIDFELDYEDVLT